MVLLRMTLSYSPCQSLPMVVIVVALVVITITHWTIHFVPLPKEYSGVEDISFPFVRWNNWRKEKRRRKKKEEKDKHDDGRMLLFWKNGTHRKDKVNVHMNIFIYGCKGEPE